jgi:hypothetical protein
MNDGFYALGLGSPGFRIPTEKLEEITNIFTFPQIIKATTVLLHVAANSSFIIRPTIRRCFNFAAVNIVEREYVMEQVVEALSYKPKFRGLISR